MTNEAQTVKNDLGKLVGIIGRGKAAKALNISPKTVDSARSGRTMLRADKYLVLVRVLQKLTEAGLA